VGTAANDLNRLPLLKGTFIHSVVCSAFITWRAACCYDIAYQ